MGAYAGFAACNGDELWCWAVYEKYQFVPFICHYWAADSAPVLVAGDAASRCCDIDHDPRSDFFNTAANGFQNLHECFIGSSIYFYGDGVVSFH